MELTLEKRSIPCFNKVYDSRFTREETAESVVPDIMPDIEEILSADGIVLLRSKQSEAGRVSLTGSIGVQVLYLPEDGAHLKRLSLDIPFSISEESPEFFDGTRAIVGVRLTDIEARALNPRKVLVRAAVCVDLQCYEERELEVCDGVAGEADILVRHSLCGFSPVTGVREKTFVLADEYMLPSSRLHFGELLSERVDFAVEDVKAVGNKLIFKGAAQVSLLYSSEDESELAEAAFTTSFSQIIDMESAYDQPDTDVRIMLTGAYFEPVQASEGWSISCELHMVAQAACSEKIELRYVSDAFSTGHEAEVYRETLDVGGVERKMVVRETFRELYEVTNPVREVIRARATLSPPEVIGREVICPATVNVIYRDDSGRICSTDKAFEVRVSIELENAMEVNVTNVSCTEVYASGAAGGMEIRVPFDIDLAVISQRGVEVVSGIELSDEPVAERSERPSVTVVSAESADIWELAKKYRSTPELIAAANSLAGSDVDAGNVLLIPSVR